VFADSQFFARWDAQNRPNSGSETAPSTKPCELAKFADWLVEAGECARITSAHLRALYGEFTLFTDTPPLSEGKLFRGLRAAGIIRYREGKGARRWLYRLSPSRCGGGRGIQGAGSSASGRVAVWHY
jgi:hypothetical protein